MSQRPFTSAPALSREELRQLGFKLQRERTVEKLKQFDISQQEKAETRKKLEKLLQENKGCWITEDGRRVCKGNNNLFVSPQEFGRRIDNFIQNDLPKGLAIALAGASFVGAGVVPLAILAPAVGISKGLSLQKSGFGPSPGRSGLSKADEIRRIAKRDRKLIEDKQRREFFAKQKRKRQRNKGSI